MKNKYVHNYLFSLSFSFPFIDHQCALMCNVMGNRFLSKLMCRFLCGLPFYICVFDIKTNDIKNTRMKDEGEKAKKKNHCELIQEKRERERERENLHLISGRYYCIEQIFFCRTKFCLELNENKLDV